MTKRVAAGARQSTIPPTMKAAAIDRFGPPSVLTTHRLPVPKPGPREVLIALHAAGVGSWDGLVRDGSWRPWGPKAKFPIVPGTDGAGIVVGAGASVRKLHVGDSVWACHYSNPKGGFYAQYIAVDAGSVGRVPEHLNLLEAGAAPTTGLTALQGVDGALKLKRGETVLIVGAAGGVGSLAVQFAKLRGARVIGTASNPEAAALVRLLGAEAVIDARSPDSIRRLKELAPDGLDAVFALAGGDGLERCIDFVRMNGRVAYPNGVEPVPRRRPNLRFLAYDGEYGPTELTALERASVEARLQVPLAATYPLDQAAAAHTRVVQGRLMGRIALRIREERPAG
ncbi:MAG: NADP-dependent oxidoreductase [Methanobacteriota archaeon]|nr:MAG: NADP-dependent oxidoreductase [Euryarchaeota archaeon]